MNVYQKRIYILSRISTLSLTVFLVSFVITRLYLWGWNSIDRSVSDAPALIDILLWILLPIILSLSTPFVLTALDWRFFRIKHRERKKFYLLSWIIFAGLIFLSFFDYRYIDTILPLVTALAAIFVFQLYQMNENSGKGQAR